jgi:3D-(3,5/4)-trihydroxycyclohexane-1,2-dione acylhydrolase (decyclizing)
MSKVRLTMAQALLRFLDRQYVRVDGEEIKLFAGLMGIFGHGNVTGIGEALERDPGAMTFIQGKNEQGMVHAAIAYAKQKNRRQLYACTTSIGPGALNMVTAAATATINRLPVLLLPGDNFACRQPDPVLQQMEVGSDYTVSAADAFKPVSRYWDRIVRPEQLLTAAIQAVRVLIDPAETGAVTLALPQDVQAEAYDYPESFFAKKVHHLDRRAPNGEALARVAELVNGKKKPLIIAGGGVRYSGAEAELAAFAEAFRIPVAETQAGKGCLVWDHPMNMGAVGVTGSMAANLLARDADLIIGIGTRYSDFTTSSKSAFGHPEVRFVNMNVNGSDSAKLEGEALVADAMAGLRALRGVLAEAGYRSGYEEEELADLKRQWDQETDRLYGLDRDASEGMAQTRALGIINETLEPSDIVLGSAGSLPGDLHRLWRVKEPGGYHMEYGFSCMGYEVCGAFGAALAEPDKEVFAMVGDGSYLMLHSEIVTSLQEGRKMTVLLFNNHGYQCIHGLQRSQGSDGFGNEFRYREEATGRLTGGVLPIDFTAHARSMGVEAFTAGTPEELRAALGQARQAKRTALVEILVAPGTQTSGYESWWRIGVPEVSTSPKVTAAHEAMAGKIAAARDL